MRALAVSMVATASHQSTPPDSILKMSREGAIAIHLPFLGCHFLPSLRYPVCALLHSSDLTLLLPYGHDFGAQSNEPDGKIHHFYHHRSLASDGFQIATQTTEA